MKRSIVTAIAVFVLLNTTVAQNLMTQTIAAADVKTVDGKTVNTSKFTNDGKPIVISFWATWCKPCKKELDAIAETYQYLLMKYEYQYE